MANLDPRTIWLSANILLSDLMGCDSCYRYGYPNRITDADKNKLDEGRHLAERLQRFVEKRAVSFTYGYISPTLSKAIVKYQDPNKPSYHRWDYGAALDLCVHGITRDLFFSTKAHPRDPWKMAENLAFGNPPLLELLDMHEHDGMRWSRAITYAESDIFCFGTRLNEKPGQERMATYNNKYIPGEAKPKFEKIPQSKFPQVEKISHQWRGRGWPSYHGGGRRQYEHVRIGVYNLLSDLLYDAVSVSRGKPNRPPLGKKKNNSFLRNAMLAGMQYETLVYELGQRLPIVAAYVNPETRHCDIDRSFEERFVLDLAVPRNLNADDLNFNLSMNVVDLIDTYQFSQDYSVVRMIGKKYEELDQLVKVKINGRMRSERETFRRGINK